MILQEPVTKEPRDSSTTSFRFNGVQVGTRVIPARGSARGGDWCEAFDVDADVLALSIGDISGHGVEKYATMVAVRRAIRDAARGGFDPAQTLVAADRFLQRCQPGEMATAIFALYDTRRRTLTYANAGHPAPLMIGPFGALFLDESVSDLPLGVERDAVPVIRTISVPAATLFVFYTDGVTESGRDSIDGATRLRSAAQFAHTFPELPSATTIDALMLPPSNFDDAAILTVRTPLSPVVRGPRRKSFDAGSQARAVVRVLSAACRIRRAELAPAR
jgi:serine phosphatase RsbU (regulator of sigma subunit)